MQFDSTNISVNVKISRTNFNQLCEDLFDKAMEMVERALRTARISAEQIDNVVILLLEKNKASIYLSLDIKFRFWLVGQVEFQKFEKFCRINLIRQS